MLYVIYLIYACKRGYGRYYLWWRQPGYEEKLIPRSQRPRRAATRSGWLPRRINYLRVRKRGMMQIRSGTGRKVGFLERNWDRTRTGNLKIWSK
jgi:hypothetical protein